MSDTLEKVRGLVSQGEVRISLHGYDQLSADDIPARDAIGGVANSGAVEDYPQYPKGPCVLALQHDSDGRPIHIVWGIPAGQNGPAVLVTGYRPDPDLWDSSFRRRTK